MKKRLFIIVLILAVLASAVVYWARNGRHRGLVLTGIVTTDDVIVSAQISGRIDRLLVGEGDAVKRNQLLAVIESKEMKADQAFFSHSEEGSAAQVQEAEAALKFQELQTRDQIAQAEAALAGAQAQQAEAAAEVERARLDFVRAEGLFKQGIVSAQVADQARTTYQAAQAHVDALRKQVEAQRATVALAHSNAEQVAVRQSALLANRHQLAAAGAQKEKAEVRLGYTEILSPIEGLVSVRAARQGEVVNAGQPILSLINPDDLWVRADVEESYIDRIRLGERMPVRFPSGLERTGVVFFRGLDAAFATQRDVSRTKRDIKTFEIRLRVDNSDRRLYPGFTAFVTMPLQTE